MTRSAWRYVIVVAAGYLVGAALYTSLPRAIPPAVSVAGSEAAWIVGLIAPEWGRLWGARITSALLGAALVGVGPTIGRLVEPAVLFGVPALVLHSRRGFDV
jgi:hypothetical protein